MFDAVVEAANVFDAAINRFSQILVEGWSSRMSSLVDIQCRLKRSQHNSTPLFDWWATLDSLQRPTNYEKKIVG